MWSNRGGDSYGRGGGGFGLPFTLGEIPVVKGLLIATVSTFLLFFLTYHTSFSLAEWVSFQVRFWYQKPWTWFTYPFLEGHPLYLIFNCLWLFFIGGMLERSWSSRNFAALFFIFAGIGAIGFLPAYYLLRAPIVLAGLPLTLSALTVAWAALDPEQEIYFWGLIPLKAKVLAVLDVLLLYFFFGFAMGPAAALFTFVSPAAAWYYVRKMPRLNIGFRAPRARQAPPRLLREDIPNEREKVGGLNPMRKRREQEEIERLRKLLGDDDDDRPVRRH